MPCRVNVWRRGGLPRRCCCPAAGERLRWTTAALSRCVEAGGSGPRNNHGPGLPVPRQALLGPLVCTPGDRRAPMQMLVIVGAHAAPPVVPSHSVRRPVASPVGSIGIAEGRIPLRSAHANNAGRFITGLPVRGSTEDESDRGTCSHGDAPADIGTPMPQASAWDQGEKISRAHAHQTVSRRTASSPVTVHKRGAVAGKDPH